MAYTDKEHTHKWRSYVPVVALSNTEKDNGEHSGKQRRTSRGDHKNEHAKMTT